MIKTFAICCACSVVAVGHALAADTALGTLVAKGKTHVLKQVYVTRALAPEKPVRAYLVVLVSDVPIDAASRHTDRLVELAKAGRLHAVRIVWSEGFDRVIATPFDGTVEDSGQATIGGAVIDLQEYDEKHLKAKITSKALGQEWHFSASLSAAVEMTPMTDEDRRDAIPVVPPTGLERDTKVEKDDRLDPLAAKRTLGRFGYEYTAEAFTEAVKDGALEATKLFLRLGMSPNVKDSIGGPLLISAVTMCTRDPQGDRLAILQALIAAKATIDVKDGNGSSPLLWSVTAQCPTDFARALVAAGADVNVKAKGGGTPLMLAKVFQRADLVDLLVKAGAR